MKGYAIVRIQEVKKETEFFSSEVDVITSVIEVFQSKKLAEDSAKKFKESAGVHFYVMETGVDVVVRHYGHTEY